jgi:hypothetical protein
MAARGILEFSRKGNPMKIDKEQARQIAQEECARRGWPWREPIYIRWGWFNYHVWGAAKGEAILL